MKLKLCTIWHIKLSWGESIMGGQDLDNCSLWNNGLQ